MQNRKQKLLQLINEKLAEAKADKSKRTKPKPATRAQINRANGAKSTGPKTAEGKAHASANSLKHGFFANTEKLNPADSTLYQETYADLRMGLQPDGPVEEHLIRELATLSARLQRLEAAEYALLLGNIEADPSDCRELALAFQKAATPLDQLHKAELHLRRAYNRTWDRLERMQKDRHKLPLDESLKRSERWLNYYHQKENPTAAEKNPAKEGDSEARKQGLVPAINVSDPESGGNRAPKPPTSGKEEGPNEAKDVRPS
jgi:hypothetical protein